MQLEKETSMSPETHLSTSFVQFVNVYTKKTKEVKADFIVIGGGTDVTRKRSGA